MNAKEIIEKLYELMITPEAFVNHTQEPDYYLLPLDKMRAVLGDFEIVDETTERADEHTVDYWNYRKGTHVLFFKDHGVYLRTGWYKVSYETEEYQDWKEVKPVTKIVYE